MSELETRTYGQLPPLVAISDDALFAVQEPDGPLGTVPSDALKGMLTARQRAFGGSTARTVDATLDDFEVSVFEAFTPAQIAAVRAGTPIAGLGPAIQSVLDYAGTSKAAVLFPWGSYDLRQTLYPPAEIFLRGEMPSFPKQDYNPGLTRSSGTMLFNNHAGDCLRVIGTPTAMFTGSVVGTLLTVVEMAPGSKAILRNMMIQGPGITPGTWITETEAENGARTGEGGTGTYTVSVAQAVAESPLAGIPPYATGGGIRDLAISGDGTQWATGDGLVVDHVGGYRIDEFRAYSISGDALVLGKQPADVTGQIHANGIYINNPGGRCIVNRSRWLKGSQIETDGGTISYDAFDAAQSSITQFHFEGPMVSAVRIRGGSTFHKLIDGYIACTNPAAGIAVELGNEAGNNDHIIEAVQLVGGASMTCLIYVGGAAWDLKLHRCLLQGPTIGVKNFARGADVTANTFRGNTIGYEIDGDEQMVHHNKFLGGSSFQVAHSAGGGGIVSDNITDQNFFSYATAVAGDFGTYRVANNRGFKTGARGKTAAQASGVVIPHGLVAGCVPETVEVWSKSALPVDFAFAWDATNITATWTGGASFELQWAVRAKSENQ